MVEGGRPHDKHRPAHFAARCPWQELVGRKSSVMFVKYSEAVSSIIFFDNDKTVVNVGLNGGISQNAFREGKAGPNRSDRENAACGDQDL